MCYSNKCRGVLKGIDIERTCPYMKWFIVSINKEAEKIIREDKIPSKLYLKYPFDPPLAAFMSIYGLLSVVIDETIECLLKVE